MTAAEIPSIDATCAGRSPPARRWSARIFSGADAVFVLGEEALLVVGPTRSLSASRFTPAPFWQALATARAC